MFTAFIYDHVRTPRRLGKKDGSLFQASPVRLARTLLLALQQRNALDTALVEDLALGCVTPVGEQGADSARTAVPDAEWAQTVAGDGILVATMNLPGRPMNVVNDELMLGLAAAVERLADPAVKGLVLTSHKAGSCAGGNLDRMSKWTRREQAFEAANAMKTVLRKLETQGKPVVAQLSSASHPRRPWPAVGTTTRRRSTS